MDDLPGNRLPPAASQRKACGQRAYFQERLPGGFAAVSSMTPLLPRRAISVLSPFWSTILGGAWSAAVPCFWPKKIRKRLFKGHSQQKHGYCFRFPLRRALRKAGRPYPSPGPRMSCGELDRSQASRFLRRAPQDLSVPWSGVWKMPDLPWVWRQAAESWHHSMRGAG